MSKHVCTRRTGKRKPEVKNPRLSDVANWPRDFTHRTYDKTVPWPSQRYGGAGGAIRTHRGFHPTVCETAAFTSFATPAPNPATNPGNPWAGHGVFAHVPDRGSQDKPIAATRIIEIMRMVAKDFVNHESVAVDHGLRPRLGNLSLENDGRAVERQSRMCPKRKK